MGALRQTTKTTLLLCLVALTGCGTIVRQDNSARTVVLGRVAGPSEKAATSFLPDQEAVFPTLEELRLLATHPQTEGELGGKLDTLWHTPIVSNAAAQKGQPVPVAHNDFMGPFLRFGTWNIEKSLKMDEAITALTSADGYEALVDEKAAPPESDRRQTMMRQRERLSQVDILCLQEMDIGVSRSDYVDAARRLAESMDMNLAYDIQYLEIDPALTAEADPARAKGAFGSAVLSRYPIKHVDLRPLRSKPYDWHAGELEQYGPVEGARRVGSEVVFKNVIGREMKVGNRNYFRVDLHVPGLPEDTLTIINIHLEIKCPPEGRHEQIREILEEIRTIRHPVIMAGDFNSASVDLSNAYARDLVVKQLKDPYTYVAIGARIGLGVGNLLTAGRVVVNTSKNLHSPLAPHIPVILPNQTKAMFNTIRDFEFADGGRFDFRGEREHSINGSSSPLANSNEKAAKGQVPSFTVRRPIGPFGAFRLDWIFVKRSVDPEAEGRLTPMFGETLVDFNRFLREQISDHRPLVVDLAFERRPHPDVPSPLVAGDRGNTGQRPLAAPAESCE